MFRALAISALATGSAESAMMIPTKVVASEGFSLIVDHTSTAYATGDNKYGQLGVGGVSNETLQDPTMVTTKVLLPADEVVMSIAAGHFHSLFLTFSGKVFAAGRNNKGQFGIPPSAPAFTPIEVMSGVKGISAGYAHSLFLMDDGTVKAAGLNAYGQLGDGTTDVRTEAARVALPAPNIIQVEAGYDFSLFRTEDKEVYGCGNNLGGQFGLGKRNQYKPTKVAEGVNHVTAGEAHTVMTIGGDLYGAGANYADQLSNAAGCGNNCYTPTKLVSGNVGRGYAGGASSCYLSQDDDVFCMGSNYFGQIGFGEMKVQPAPTKVDIGSDVLTMSVSNYHSLIASMGEAIFGTGRNLKGQLGNGNMEPRMNFGQVMTIETTTTVAPPIMPTSEQPSEEPSTSFDGSTTNDGRGVKSSGLSPLFSDIILLAGGTVFSCGMLFMVRRPRKTPELVPAASTTSENRETEMPLTA